MTVLFYFIICYLVGSFPSSIVLGKFFKGIDIRKYGSKNSGATNAYRILGPKLGISVLILDALKGSIMILIGYKLGLLQIFVLLGGIITILGHIFSIYLKFHGGKGMATGMGVFLILVPCASLFSLILFIITVAFFRYISLGSIVAAFSFPFSTYFIYGNSEKDVAFLGALIAFYAIYKHKSNIKRLLNGNENKFNFKRKGE